MGQRIIAKESRTPYKGSHLKYNLKVFGKLKIIILKSLSRRSLGRGDTGHFTDFAET